MSQSASLNLQIEQIMTLMRDKLGVKADSFAVAIDKARRRMPRRVYRQGRVLARASALLDHPKLSATVNTAETKRAAQVVHGFLASIDLADQRKGWWLGMLGTLAFNLLAVFAIVMVVLVWRGIL